MKKFILLAVLVLSLLNVAGQGGVSVNNSGLPADSSAMLDISSNSHGVLVPRMTSLERDAIVKPAEALLIFNIDTRCFNVFSLGAWSEICGNCISPVSPLAGNNGPVCEGGTINLSASSVPGATYLWSGPNGFSSNLQNPIISNASLSATGQYSVIATVNNCSSLPVQTNVQVNPSPSASFTYSPSAPQINDNVTFNPSVSGAAYSWTFQGGVPSVATVQNPVVQWSNNGTYDVSLTITHNGCTASSVSQISIINCPSGSATFSFTGAEQTWVVPACVSQINIEVYGAQGNAGIAGNYSGVPAGTAGGAGGLGAMASGTLTVSGGQTLYIYVGGQNAWNGGGSGGAGVGAYGGNGGGASDVRLGGNSVSNRIIVAAGGGGGGGGAANTSCSPGSPTVGGAGSGGGSNNNGGTGSCPGGPSAGAGGYASGSGGAGGSGSYTGNSGNSASGSLGGAGGIPTFPCPPYETGCSGSGGGGGGGYTGGGGGGAAGFNGGCGAPGGGGAGGASYTGGVNNATTQASVRSGNGQIIITY